MLWRIAPSGGTKHERGCFRHRSRSCTLRGSVRRRRLRLAGGASRRPVLRAIDQRSPSSGGRSCDMDELGTTYGLAASGRNTKHVRGHSRSERESSPGCGRLCWKFARLCSGGERFRRRSLTRPRGPADMMT